VDVQVLSGEEEADFGFLAARRWYGWSAGRLLHVDLGGGSLEVAFGHGEEPELAISLPLGAGLLARELLRDDPPTTAQVDALNERISTSLSEIADRLCWEGPPVLASASSKTFKQLARVCGAAPGRRGTLVERHIKRSDLRVCAERMGNMTREERAQLRGVKQSRAGQIVAGAIIAHQLMASLHLKQVQICPWSVRDGILLRHLDRLDNAISKRDAAVAARTRQHRTTTRRSAANAR